MEKICWQITVAAFMQPLQYDLWSPAAKDNSITHAAKRGSNTCNPIYIAGTILQLQSAMEFHRQLIHQQDLQSHLHCGKDPTVANHNGISSATHPGAPLAIPFTLRERSYSCKSQWNSIGNSSSSITCNPIYIAGTILKLQITMEFHLQIIHQHHLQPHLQCGNDPTVANHNGILSTTHCTKNSWHPIYNAEPIREWSEDDPTTSEHDPTTHETVSHPSHRRGRSSRFGDRLCKEKHRVSCICYLSKTHFVRDFLQNSIGNSSTSTTCNAICSEGTILQLQITMEFCRPHMHEKQLTPHLQCGTDPRMIRGWSDHIRTTITHETVSHPSHRRGRSSRFGDGLCMEKHRVSCICYLSKTHFVRDFLQNSIGNSSTSTTCNAIYSEGTILQLQITMPWLTLSLTNSFFD